MEQSACILRKQQPAPVRISFAWGNIGVLVFSGPPGRVAERGRGGVGGKMGGEGGGGVCAYDRRVLEEIHMGNILLLPKNA